MGFIIGVGCVIVFMLVCLIVSFITEENEWTQSVELYQIPWEERNNIAELAHPETNDGIWRYK